MPKIHEFFKEFALILSSNEFDNYLKTYDSYELLSNVKNRTIISRLYYYVFLKIRDHIKSNLNRSNDLFNKCNAVLNSKFAHNLISRILKISDGSLKSDFDYLRLFRNSADYLNDSLLREINLSKTMFEDVKKFNNNLKFLHIKIRKIENKIKNLDIVVVFNDDDFIEYLEDVYYKI